METFTDDEEGEMISLRAHNILDYVVGVILLSIPAVFDFLDLDAARNVFLLGGLALIAYSAITKYQYSLWKLIPLDAHKGLDVLVGAVVMLAPWVFGYRDFLTTGQESVHYVAGLALFSLVAFTKPTTHNKFLDGEVLPYRDHAIRDRKVG